MKEDSPRLPPAIGDSIMACLASEAKAMPAADGDGGG